MSANPDPKSPPAGQKLDLNFLNGFRELIQRPDCPLRVYKAVEDIIFIDGLTLRPRLARLVQLFRSPEWSHPDFGFTEAYLSKWKGLEIDPAADYQKDDWKDNRPEVETDTQPVIVQPAGIVTDNHTRNDGIHIVLDVTGDNTTKHDPTSHTGNKVAAFGTTTTTAAAAAAANQGGEAPRPVGNRFKLIPRKKRMEARRQGQVAANPWTIPGWTEGMSEADTAPQPLGRRPRLPGPDEHPPEPSTTDRGVPMPLQPDLQDCLAEHYYKGQMQPPVGVRLGHVLNYLADEDKDRSISWESDLREIKDYLDFLSGEWEGAVGLGPGTRSMLDEAKKRVTVHELHAELHGPQAVSVPVPELVPRPEPRLRPLPGAPISLDREASPTRLPRNVRHRTPAIVNDMYVHYPSAPEHHTRLAQDEDALWKMKDGEDPPAGNLSAIENAEYETAMRRLRGWVSTEPGTGTRRLPDGSALGSDDAVSFARERGARRAGLQQCLQYFRSVENALAQTKFRRLVLPLTAAQLDAASSQAERTRVFHTHTLPRADLPKQLETHPYTVRMAEYRRLRTWWLHEARRTVEAEHGQDRDWVALPGWYDAFIFRPFDVRTTADQDLFRLMRAIVPERGEGLLGFAKAVAPRSLLGDIEFWIQQGQELRGKAPPQGLAGPSRIVPDPPMMNDSVMVTEEDVQWLKFVLTGSVTRGIAQDLPPTSGALFITFATRLQRLMDDVSDNRLFRDLETRVPLEKLLEVMQQGADSEGNEKAKFSVYDALYWVDKLKQWGRCRYEEHLSELAVVLRPKVDVHPEHLIRKSPPNADELDTYVQTIQSGRPWKLLDKQVHHYFCQLAYRYGHTYWEMQNKKKQQWASMKPAKIAQLQDSFDEWENAYEALVKKHKKDIKLTDVVKHADPDSYDDGMTEGEAAQLIRTKVLEEAKLALTPLHPTRLHEYINDDGDEMIVRRRPGVWDWAMPEVRGTARRYFSMDRWPLRLQTKETQERIEDDSDLDPRTLWDPCSEDITPVTWFKQKAKPYNLDEKVIYKAGVAAYNIGDTPLQRQMIESEVTSRVAASLGLEEQRPGFFKRLSERLPFSCPQSPQLLPHVDPKDTPHSVDWAALRTAKEAWEAAPDSDEYESMEWEEEEGYLDSL